MTISSSLLSTVADRLPFSIDDTEAANDAFRRWRARQDPDDERIVDIWTYCYVCRYFIAKSSGNTFDRTAVRAELVTRAYDKIRENREDVREADRFASWVSVVCKNTFLNYTRRDRTAESIYEEGGPTLRAEEPFPVAKWGFVREDLEDAVDELPEYLREPARLYFLEDRTFEEISEEIGKPVPTVRTYKHKAVQRLRENEVLREYMNRIE